MQWTPKAVCVPFGGSLQAQGRGHISVTRPRVQHGAWHALRKCPVFVVLSHGQSQIEGHREH